MPTAAEQTRLDKAKNAPKKLSKAERQSALVERMAAAKADPPATVSEDQKGAPEAQAPAPEGQAPAPAAAPKVRAARGSGRKLTAKVIAFRALPAFDKSWIITIKSEGNPKRRKAAIRFSHYESGMTVDAYVAKMKTHNVPASQSTADIRWDFNEGFIDVQPPPAPEPAKEEKSAKK